MKEYKLITIFNKKHEMDLIRFVPKDESKALMDTFKEFKPEEKSFFYTGSNTHLIADVMTHLCMLSKDYFVNPVKFVDVLIQMQQLKIINEDHEEITVRNLIP